MAEGAGPVTEPTVTVVIPTYERAEFLGEAIDSVLEQDYERLELLVLDDGSTDATPELLAGYAERHPGERFRWDRHDNMGQARTINRGFEMSDSELVGYLSSDDALLPGAIRKVAAALAADPAAVVAYPSWESIDDESRSLEPVVPGKFTLLRAVRGSDPVIGPGALLRRSVVDRVGGWDPSWVYSPDFEFWTRAAPLGDFLFVDEILSRYRWHEGMTGRASTGLRLARERVAIVDAVYARDDIPEELLAVRAEAYRSAYLAGAGILGINAPWERFAIADRLAPAIFPERSREFTETRDELRARVEELEAEAGVVGERIAALGHSLTRREVEVAESEGGE